MARRRDEQQDRTQPPGKPPRADRAKRPTATADGSKAPPERGASKDSALPAGEALPSAKHARRPGWLGLIGGGAALLIAALLAVAYLEWPAGMYRTATDPQASGSDALAEVEARLADVEAALAPAPAVPVVGENSARLDALAGRVAALEEAPQPDPGLAERLGALEEQIAAAADDGGAPPRSGRIQVLESKVEQLIARTGEIERRVGARERRAPALDPPALLLAVGPLRSALRGSGPFDAELTAVRAIAGSDADAVAAVEMLAPRAALGVPTIAALRAHFSAVAVRAVRAGDIPDEKSWIVDWIVSPVTKLVTVRSVGDAPGGSIDAIIARAEARLLDGDLTAAVAEVDRLEGPAAKETDDWLADARARLAAERALVALEARARAASAVTKGGR